VPSNQFLLESAEIKDAASTSLGFKEVGDIPCRCQYFEFSAFLTLDYRSAI